MKYPREQLWEIYKKLPKKLQEAIFSEETAENIASVCEKNGIPEAEISEIAEYTGFVLLGILPIEDFQKTLEKKIKLESEVAKKVSYEINRSVFSPVKESLTALSEEEITPTEAKPTEKEKAEEPILVEETRKAPSPLGKIKEDSQIETSEVVTPIEKKSATLPEKDIYREPIE